MRSAMGWKMCAAAVAVLTTFAVTTSPVPAEDSCPAGAMGVSRTVEIDTTGGPWFGAPKGDRDFLAQGEVVLTFDDGPSPSSTRSILATLANECTKATFFVVGEMVEHHPEIVAEIATQGHTIGTHSWSHPNLALMSLPQVTQQIEATFNVAQKASPLPIAPFFRYPYLSNNKLAAEYLKSRNIGQFAIDVDSLDWRFRNPKVMINRVMTGLKRRGRGIILLHDIHKSTADALPELLTQIKAAGFKVVHLRAKSQVQLVADVTPPSGHDHTRLASRKQQQRTAMHIHKPGALTTNSGGALQRAVKRKLHVDPVIKPESET